METLFTGKIVHHKVEIDSTNQWADAVLKNSKVLEGTVFRADLQTHGKGQRGRVWDSDAGKNLLVSYVFHPSFLRIDQQFGLVKAVTLAIKDTLDEYLIDKVQIKWPNDVYVNDEKLGGVLIESTMKGPIVGTSIIGIGLNVNQQSFNTGMNATSMILESGRGIVVDQLLRELNFHLEKRYLQLRSSLSQLDSSFHNALFKLNVPWKYQIGSAINVMINRGVDQIGQVLLEDDFGRVNAYGLHQVKMII